MFFHKHISYLGLFLGGVGFISALGNLGSDQSVQVAAVSAIAVMCSLAFIKLMG